MSDWIGVCVLAAALQLFCDEDRGTIGFESVCGLAVGLAFVRWAAAALGIA